MMHKFVWACGMICLLCGASTALAQDYDAETSPAKNTGRWEKQAAVRNAEVSPEFLRLQRAIKRAEERKLRIEARKWYGVSPLRPLRGANSYVETYYGAQFWPTIPLHTQGLY